MALFTRSREAPTMPANSSWVTGRTNSLAICTSVASVASASSVVVTLPSSEFSIGATAMSVSPSWTAMTVS